MDCCEGDSSLDYGDDNHDNIRFCRKSRRNVRMMRDMGVVSSSSFMENEEKELQEEEGDNVIAASPVRCSFNEKDEWDLLVGKQRKIAKPAQNNNIKPQYWRQKHRHHRHHHRKQREQLHRTVCSRDDVESSSRHGHRRVSGHGRGGEEEDHSSERKRRSSTRNSDHNARHSTIHATFEANHREEDKSSSSLTTTTTSTRTSRLRPSTQEVLVWTPEASPSTEAMIMDESTCTDPYHHHHRRRRRGGIRNDHRVEPPPIMPEFSSSMMENDGMIYLSNVSNNSLLSSRTTSRSFTGGGDVDDDHSVSDHSTSPRTEPPFSAWCVAAADEDETCSFARTWNDWADSCSHFFHAHSEMMEILPCTAPGFSDHTLQPQQRLLQEYIAGALGAPSLLYSYWTEIRIHTTTHFDPSTMQMILQPPPPPPPTQRGLVTHTTTPPRICNRSMVRDAPASRRAQLQADMTFSVAIERSRQVMPCVHTARSFPVTTVQQNHRERRILLRGEDEHKDQEDSDPVVFFYDSDPSDARSSSFYRTCPRQVAVQLQNKKAANIVRATTTATPGRIHLNHNKKSHRRRRIQRVSKKLGEDVIVQIVQTMIHDRWTLIWHPTPQACCSTNRTSHPLCVNVWIESGFGLNDGSLVLPKLSWSKALDHTTNHTTTTTSYSRSQARLRESTNASAAGRRDCVPLSKKPYHVELLDIRRVYSMETIDRTLYPLAHARTSFMVETMTCTTTTATTTTTHQASSSSSSSTTSCRLLLEAVSMDERDRIVYGLKLVIARLASMLMLRDARAEEEFFFQGGTGTTGLVVVDHDAVGVTSLETP